MLQLLSDENVHGGVVAGVQLHYPEIDLVRAQDVGLSGVEDPAVLAWAAQHNRILLSNDRRTMIAFAYDRILRGLPLPGVFALRPGTSIKEAIEAVAIVALASDPPDWENRIEFLPLT